jgi:hypothetical protein
VKRTSFSFIAYFGGTVLLTGCEKVSTGDVQTDWLINSSAELRNFSLFWLLPALFLFAIIGMDHPETEESGRTSGGEIVYTYTGRTIKGNPESGRKAALWWITHFPLVGIYLFYYHDSFYLTTGYPNLDALLYWLLVPTGLIIASTVSEKILSLLFKQSILANFFAVFGALALANLSGWIIYFVASIAFSLILWIFSK